MLPVIVPTAHVNVLDAVAVNEIFGPVPLHIDAVFAVVTNGVGLTVTVMVKGTPAQPPVEEVGVTIYCTEPEVALLGLTKLSLIVEPEPGLAPVILPVMVPNAQVKLLAALAVRLMPTDELLQIVLVAGLVTAGV